MKGDEKKSCIKQAKATHEKAEAQAKGIHEMAEAKTDSDRAKDAATSMKITAQDLLELGVIDDIIPEPIGGAHRDKDGAIERVGAAIEKSLTPFDRMNPDEVRKHRHDRFLNIGRSL